MERAERLALADALGTLADALPQDNGEGPGALLHDAACALLDGSPGAANDCIRAAAKALEARS